MLFSGTETGSNKTSNSKQLKEILYKWNVREVDIVGCVSKKQGLGKRSQIKDCKKLGLSLLINFQEFSSSLIEARMVDTMKCL
jgi:hypothetical protein